MRIAIGSAGRRLYLVQWFQEALHKARIHGELHVFDHDEHASAKTAADGYRSLPRYDDSQYRAALLAAIDDVQPDLFFSLNDYELSLLSGGLADEIRERRVIVPSLTKEMHQIVSDKNEMYRTLRAAGIPTPATAILSNPSEVANVVNESNGVILKDRVGSASSGLLRLTREEATARMEAGTLYEDYMKAGVHLDSIIVQSSISGEEFGVDIVASPFGGDVQGVLARRKLRMRYGETSAAVTVDPASFIPLGKNLGNLLGVQGLVDVDVIEQSNGDKMVIDINPRFGGGYPFNQIAGADVPSYYVSEISGRSAFAGWNQYRAGVRSAKHEGIVAFDSTPFCR